MLYSYCIPYDDGAAPNPFWGVCTLAICKPVIRRTAQEGDWVVGTGSRNSPIGDCSGRVVYAMQVTRKVTMHEYDALSHRHLRQKRPDWLSRDHRRRLGDSIYDFSTWPPTERDGVHGLGNQQTDLGGEYVLTSNRFYYFGDRPVGLPEELLPIVKQGQGHKSLSNQPHETAFVDWISGLHLKPNVLHGKPQLDLFARTGLAATCAEERRRGCEEDERIGDEPTGP